MKKSTINGYFSHKKGTKAFTLIELLVVIAIIGVLATIVLVSLGSASAKARDARRQEDMHTIMTALETYYDTYGCLPIENGGTHCPGAGVYSESNYGGWDFSSMGGWMTFLTNSGIMSTVPIDPVNNFDPTTNPTGDAYRFYCTSSTPNGFQLNYYSEVKKTWLNYDGGPYTATFNPMYICK